MASNHTREARSLVTASPVSRSCIVFAYFCFDFDFGVNMKVVDNFVSFLMTLV
ncbi:hypothetical protein MTR_5g082960 [Medicago truncatula]|uniref:Uncharacterized protein n=1 Tax=Medicago truncatula TaxID=3880 RepID=G7K265_MEDTR|nr:hypothetical protein MTR_5g082960 [Medicago truncatula]